jgi:hypothetical protein
MKFVFVIFLTSISIACFSQHIDTLTNDKVIKLYKAGFSNDVLTSKIQNSFADFDVSIDGMMNLKKAGIPDDIISLMVSKPSKMNNSVSNNRNVSATSARDSKEISLASGIYYKNIKAEYLEIEPSILTSTKTNRAAQVFVSGLINAKVKATISGKQSTLIVNENLPKFIFAFDTTNRNSLNTDNNQWFFNARSPKEFILVKLAVVKNSREIIVGKANAVGSNFGIDDKSVIPFAIKKLANGVYEIAPESELKEGEYCFMFAQGLKQGAPSKVFDFGIRKLKGF